MEAETIALLSMCRTYLGKKTIVNRLIHQHQKWCGEISKTKECQKHFPAGTRTRVFRVRAEYPNQLDYREVICW